MEYKRFGHTCMVRFDLNEEILEGLEALCEKEGIGLARVDAIGAINHGAVGVYDLQKRAYCQEELNGFMEIASLTGNITSMNDKPYVHLHAVLADQDHAIHAGHALELRVGATCEMFIDILEGCVERQRDESMGINLWRLSRD